MRTPPVGAGAAIAGVAIHAPAMEIADIATSPAQNIRGRTVLRNMPPRPWTLFARSTAFSFAALMPCDLVERGPRVSR